MVLQVTSAHLVQTVNLPPATYEFVKMVIPEKFDGVAEGCRGFLQHCEISFAHQPEVYREESAKCAFIHSLLTRRALDWASGVWDQICRSMGYFWMDVSLQLLQLRQGTDSAADFIVKFGTLAVQSGWNEVAMQFFEKG